MTETPFQAERDYIMLIENGFVFTGEQFVGGLLVRLQNGIVSEVGEKTAADSTETRIDL